MERFPDPAPTTTTISEKASQRLAPQSILPETVSAMIERALKPALTRIAPSGARRILTKAMLGRLRTRWREAYGTRLKRQLENASLYVRDLGDEQAERFGRGLNYLFNDWVERFGPVKDCEVRTRKRTVKEMKRDARRRYEHDMGAAYALEFLSYHIEASYLPGDDAAFVYDLTSYYISQAGDAARKMASESPRDESETGSSGF
jgi:hypothetical protein